jgi:hypothetical protein
MTDVTFLDKFILSGEKRKSSKTLWTLLEYTAYRAIGPMILILAVVTAALGAGSESPLHRVPPGPMASSSLSLSFSRPGQRPYFINGFEEAYRD